uniref:glycosyltransferase family 2 protein n=1 Tax=Polynucleobacter sp. TaxID=2029855 RepID=UPI004047F8DF
MNKACVDVVVPVFNGSATIAQALESAMAQEGPWLNRIIVIDDGSTDNTAAVVAAVASDRIHLVCTSNQGVAKARNLGITQSRAPWIAFLDADDWWEKDKLAIQLNAAEQSGAGFVCGAVNHQPVSGARVISAWALWRGNYVATSSVLVQREVLMQIAPVFQTDMRFAEDYLAWLKCLTLTKGYYVASNVATYILSETPRYRWGQIMTNLARLNIIFAGFLWGRECGLPKKALLPAVLLVGSLVSLVSIAKRFLSPANCRG